jgi:hypothetical protein
MTSENDKPIQGAGGKDQRPHATLNLTATEVFHSGKRAETNNTQSSATSPGATAPSDAAASGGTRAGPSQADAALPPPRDPYSAPPRPGGGSGGGGFMSQLGAGLIGASLALAVGFLLVRTQLPHGERGPDLRGTLAAAELRIAMLENAAKTSSNAAGGIDSRLQSASDQAGALKQDVAALGKRIGALEGKPAGAAAGPSAEAVQQSLEPVHARIAVLDTRLAELDTRLAALAKSQEELRATAGSAALAMAVQNLRRAVADGKPFATELKTVTALAPEPLEVASLQARRESGLASLTKLQRDFDAPAKAAIAAARTPGDGSATSSFLAKIRSLFRVRPTGEVAGGTPEAILARAETRLDAGDLSAALGEASALSGPAADAMIPWLTEAKARADADETLAKLEAKLMTSLGSDERAKRGG